MKSAYEKTLDVLEWPQFLKRVSENAQSPMGETLILEHKPDTWPKENSQLYAEAIAEVVELHQKQKALPLSDLADLSKVYLRMSRSGMISVEEFAQIIRNQKSLLSLKQVVQAFNPVSQGTALKQSLSQIDPLTDWCDVHFPLIDQHGEIADSASDDLRALRLLVVDLKEKIDAKLKHYLRDPHFGEVLQEDYVTLRDGRYVIPIKNNFKGRVGGIIHGVSKTEQTLFVEPEAVVQLNNQLKVAEQEIEIEIERILAEVVERSRDVIPYFETNQKMLALADYLQSVARVISLWKTFCIAKEGSHLSFEALAHPLLSLESAVVSNSLTWEEALVLSGPNTGGKTVLLKSVGMAMLFNRAGIPICASSAEFPAQVQRVFAEMGDDQNLFEKLSTFSAHVTSLRQILAEAKEGDLVLVDELATGTSPEEGQALARAILEELLERKIRSFVTTHYASLKVMALADQRCRVASMSYDRAKRMPLFKVVMDVPGESSAFDAAERLGFSQKLMDRARVLMGEESKDLTIALKALENSRKIFEEKISQSNELNAKLKQKENEIEKLKALAEEKLRKLSREEAREELKLYRELRSQISDKVASLNSPEQATQIFEEVADASQKLRDISQDIVVPVQKRGVLVSELKKGFVVEISGLGLGVVDEDFTAQTLNSKSMITVKVGEIKTRVSFDRIFAVTNDEKIRFEQGRKSWLNVEKRKY